MQIDVKKVFLYNDDSFEANGIDDKKYELIKYHSYKEREIWRINSVNLHTIATVENSIATLYKKTLELLIAYDNLKGKKYYIPKESGAEAKIRARFIELFGKDYFDK